MSNNYTEVLTALDYPYRDMGSYILTQARFRNGDSLGSIAIYKNNNGKVIDFVTGKSYQWLDFVSLCSGQLVNGQDLLKDVDLTVPIAEKPLLTEQTILDESLIKNLIPDHSYWIGRGISKEVLTEFDGGLCNEGKMKGRYVFSIYNSKKELVGLTGRDITGKNKYRWLHEGQKTKWIYPPQINLKDLKNKKEVILVESVGCLLSLFSAGIRNCLCLFGIKISPALISFLIKLDPLKLIISTNNELNEENQGVGNQAAIEIKNTLLNYFSSDRIIVKLPFKKDFNLMKTFEIKEWYDQIRSY